MTSWTVHATGLSVPEPLPQTCYDVAHAWQISGSYGCEPQESRLIRINGVTWSGTWPNPNTNGTVTLTDASGSCTLFVDRDTGLDDMTPPTGPFDIIGVLKQYDTSQPLNSGYQIVPRSPDDIVIPGPRILTGPEETDVRPDQVTIVWTTDVPADSRVDYGLTGAYELGSVSDAAYETEHAITLTGLASARTHHYRVQSRGLNGVNTISGDELFCTASGPEAGGEIRVWFNKVVDTTLALGTPAEGLVNLPGKLVERIDAAQYSIDACIYSFDLASVADALIAAQQRGVAVRFIYDDRDGAGYQYEVQRLQAAGIPVIDDAFGSNDGNGLMHNKFFIFDHRNGSPDDADDWLWTGSHNVTSAGSYTDAQNVIAIQDAALAEIYTVEFNEMWGSDTDTPNAALSRFGANKTANTPQRAWVQGTPMRVFFSPSDGVVGAIRNEIAGAESSIHFAILSFTRDDISNDLKGKWLYTPGFELRGVFDHAELGNTSSVYHDMIGTGPEPWSPPADVWLDQEAGSLHHKYMILDANRHGEHPTVITGSANWSNNAAYDNDENVLIVEDFAVANQYLQEFSSRYHIAGGSGDLSTGAPTPAAAAAAWSIAAGPNPANGPVVLRYQVPSAVLAEVALFSVDGRRERTLFRGELAAGTGALPLRLDGSGGLPAGLHFVRLDAGGRTLTTRLLVVR